MRKGIILILLIIPLALLGKSDIVSMTASNIIVQQIAENISIFNEDGYSHIYIKDFTTRSTPGTQEIPYKDFNIGIPPNGRLEVNYDVIEREVIKLDKPLSPVPNIIESGKTFDYIYKIQPELYNTNEKTIQIQPKSKYRFNDFVPVRFYPVQYDQDSNEITIIQKIQINIKIIGDTKYRNYVNEKNDMSASDMLINYNYAKNWKETKNLTTNKIPFERSDFWYKIVVNKQGWFEIDQNDLKILPEFCSPTQLRLLTLHPIKTNDKTEFELNEIPISVKINDGIYKIIFENDYVADQDKTTFWLTFGGDFKTDPIQTKFPETNNLMKVDSFEKRVTTVKSSSREDVDGVIIYPDDITTSITDVFETQAQDYAQLHPEMNFIIKSQSEIFDEFGGGNPEPQAVENYLELEFYGDGSPQYPGHPEMQYVVLMGSGIEIWNPQNNKNKIIVALVPNSVVSDDEFVDFNDDNRPELIIGRIPAQNDQMMDHYLQRLQDYIQQPNLGFWRNEVLIMADDEHKGEILEGCGTTTGMNHSAHAQTAEDFIADTVITDKILGIEYGFDEYQNKPDARLAMMEQINQGKLIWYFIGHGNEDVMGDEDYFRASLHMDLLDNMDHLPLYLAASCEVGKFDNTEIDCISEKFLFNEGGGSIASIAATAKVHPDPNTILMKHVLRNIVNERMNIGNALREAKLNSNASLYNSHYFNVLGDPIIDVLPPLNSGFITGIPDSVQARQTVNITGDLENDINEIGETRIFESKYNKFYENTLVTPEQTYHYEVDYTANGNKFYFGNITINNGEFDAQFIVPEDVHSGNEGRIINYVIDNTTNNDLLNCYLPMKLSSIPVNVISTGNPEVELFLGSESFVAGDYVSTTPQLIAHIQDENGINILDSSGHSILMLLDDSITPINVTSGFVYDIGSATSGILNWQLEELSEGSHTLQLIVFDNLNNPTVAETNFISKSSGVVSIEQMLPYPNPMKNGGHFTFVITEGSDITLTIYTLTGRKIKTIKKPNSQTGYNQIYWDGKDDDGDEIANNTYFYKIKAKQLSNSKVSEKIGKLIILK